MNKNELEVYLIRNLLKIGYPERIISKDEAHNLIRIDLSQSIYLNISIEMHSNGVYAHFSNGNSFEDIKNKNEDIKEVIDRCIDLLKSYYKKGAEVRSVYKFGKIVEQKLVIDGEEEGWITHPYFFIPFVKKVTKISKIPAVKDLLKSKN